MTDLSGKFTGFEGLIAQNHTEMMEALNALISGIGGVPTVPTTTLTDVVTALNNINSNIVQLRSANALYYSSALNALNSINVNTDTIINNNSVNAQRLLQAILATACACETEVPFTQPALDVTPTDLVDDIKCARIQYYLSIFGAMIDGIANYGGAGAMVTSAALTEILYAAVVGGGLVGGEVGAAAGPPGIVIGAIVGIIGALIASLGSSYIYSMSAQWHQSPLPEQLLAALYAANTAAEGADAFYAVINASDVLNTPFKPLINALFWNGWANDIYSTTPVVDTSGFDGSICAPAGEVVVLTQSCGDLINQVFQGVWDSGDRNGLTYTHFILGAASAGTGTVKLFADTIEVLNLNVNGDGQDKVWIGVAANVRVIGNVSADTYYHLQACTGTYG